LPFWREKNKSFWDLWGVPLVSWKASMQVPPTWPSDVSGAIEWWGTLSCESTVFLKACLFHPHMRVSRWDADSECWPYY
jgi:hypothetical protein